MLTKQINRLQMSLTVAYAIAIVCFFALVYPHHLHFQEQYQLFLFRWSYVSEVCSVPGGVADLMGRFLTQFFMFAWAGAPLIMLVLMGIQQCMARLMRGAEAGLTAVAFALSFLPSSAMWVFLCDENALMSAPVSLLIVLSVALAVRCIRPLTVRAVAGLIAVPLTYWLAGGMALILALLPIVDLLREEHSLKTVAVSLVLAVVALSAPAACHHLVTLPLDRLFAGPHYYRYPAIFPTWAWVAACLPALGVLVAAVLNRRPQKPQKCLATASAWGLAAVLTGIAVGQSYDVRKEVILGYDFMARNSQWNRIINSANHKAPNDPVSVTALNLALSVKGLMADHMFDYTQHGLAGLLPEFVRDPFSPLVTSEAYYQLGMINTAQCYVFEAQEAIPDFQKSGRCYKRLAETNLINGSYAVARKYLEALQSTLLYRSWANETLQLLGDEEAIGRHPEYGKLRQYINTTDFFYSEHLQMLGQLFLSNRSNRLAYEYLLAACMLQNDLDMFVNCYGLNTEIKYPAIPSVYQQALMLWWSRDHSADEAVPDGTDPNIVRGIRQFYKEYQSAPANRELLKQHYGKTYWYYYFSL